VRQRAGPFHIEDANMSKRKAEAVEPAEAAFGTLTDGAITIEADGVETVEQAPEQQPEAEQQPAADEPGYRVVWHIKHAGRLYAPGERITELDDDAAAPFLASGAIA
jgi:hypothetical protein